MINTRTDIKIAFPHTQRPVGLGRSSFGSSCGNFGVGFGLGCRFSFTSGLGLDVDADFCIGLGAVAGCGDGVGFGSGSEGAIWLGDDAGLKAVPNGMNASQDRVSALTCIPYLMPACLALVQLKNLSAFFGLKF